MYLQEAALIGLCVLVSTLWLRREIQREVIGLDSRIAEAIKSIVESASSINFDGIEPPNPMQGLLMEMLKSRMAPPAVEVIERESSGRFKS